MDIPVGFYSKYNALSIIKDDIRNYRKLNEKQILYIKSETTDFEKTELIELLNKCLSIVCKLLMKDELIDNKIN